jgi:hypothetical protein
VKPVVSLFNRWRFGEGDFVAVDSRFLPVSSSLKGKLTHKIPLVAPTSCTGNRRYKAHPVFYSSDKLSSLLPRSLKTSSDQHLHSV